MEAWMITLAVSLAGCLVAWGDIRAQLKQHKDTLDDVSKDVKRINGTVTRHDEAIKTLKEGH